MKILRARLYELERSRIENERSKDRKNKIELEIDQKELEHNFPEEVTDHRINLHCINLRSFLREKSLMK